MTKWALVTGSAKRIGRVIALDLAAAGWNIIVHYHTSQAEAETLADEIQDLGCQACLAEIDLANTKLIENLIPSLAAELGPITLLVNNASLFEPDSLDPTGTRHASINAEAPRLLSEAFYKQDQSGLIINLLDSNPAIPYFTAYNASKKTLQTMTRDMALRFAPRVRVNGVALGSILPSSRQSPEHFQKCIEATPLRTQTMPQDVASAVRFLAETTSITGEILHVDGGLHLCPSKG